MNLTRRANSGIVVTLVSQSRHGVSGPAAGLAVMVYVGIQALGFEAYLLSVIVCGVVQVCASYMKAGVIAHYFPSSVIKGMLAGIGIILILKQIPHALGYDQSYEGELSFFQLDGHNTFTEIGYALRALSPGAMIITAASLAILLLWQRPVVQRNRFARAVPAPLIVVMLGVILGGRLGYTLFYGWANIAADPLYILKIWEGGMSFHGGLVGVIAAMWLFARRRQRPFFDVADFVAPLVPLGLAAGRLGNFVNGELWGKPTDLPWGMIFPAADELPRHPNPLYEAFLEGFVLFIILWWFSSKPRARMATIALFFIGTEISRATLRELRGAVLVQGLLLWLVVAPLTLLLITNLV